MSKNEGLIKNLYDELEEVSAQLKEIRDDIIKFDTAFDRLSQAKQSGDVLYANAYGARINGYTLIIEILKNTLTVSLTAWVAAIALSDRIQAAPVKTISSWGFGLSIILIIYFLLLRRDEEDNLIKKYHDGISHMLDVRERVVTALESEFDYIEGRQAPLIKRSEKIRAEITSLQAVQNLTESK